MNQRPIVMTIMLLVTINLVFLGLAAVVATAINPEPYATFFHALAAVFSFLVVPATVAGLEDTGMIVLGTTVVVVGMLLFTGTIIALVTTTLRDYLINKGGARGKLNISGHIVILNYNAEVPAMLVKLMCADERRTVLVLSDKEKSQVRADLLSSLATLDEKPAGRLKLIVRQGNPSSLCELHEIGLTSAAGLLIVNDRSNQSDQLGNADYLGVLKLVLTISNLDFPENFPIGVETCTQVATDTMTQMQNDIDGLKNKNIHFFSHHKMLGEHLASHIDTKNLYVIGENKKLKYMLNALADIKVRQFRKDEIAAMADSLAKNNEANVTLVILSDDTTSPEAYDANVFLALIELSQRCGIANRNFKIIAEIIDPNNKKNLEKFNVQSIVISTEIISSYAVGIIESAS